MKKREKKLSFEKEVLRTLAQPDLRKAVGGTDPTTTWITCTVPSIREACTTYLSCGGGCDTA
jgi:hypothetical protein